MCVACHRWVHKGCSGIAGRMRNNVDLYCRRCSSQEVVLRKVEIELGVRVECLPKACYLGDIHLVSVGHGVKEAARATFKELFPILTACRALYHIEGEIYRACVQSASRYVTEA